MVSQAVASRGQISMAVIRNVTPAVVAASLTAPRVLYVLIVCWVKNKAIALYSKSDKTQNGAVIYFCKCILAQGNDTPRNQGRIK